MNLNASVVKRMLPARGAASHKGDNGVVLVVGGSRDFAGAPALAGLGALRAGADISILLVPEFIHCAVASFSPDLIVRSYPGAFLNSSARKEFKRVKATALSIGNGLSKEKGVLRSAQSLASSFNGPVIVDGDALGAVFPSNAIFTPHSGEFERLSGARPPSSIKERGEAVKALARKLHSVVLLKGSVDVISDGSHIAFNSTGNAGMTVGGTGDVLAGVVSAFAARGVPLFESACAGAFVAGSAGDCAFKEYGNGLLASDLLPFVARSLKSMGR